MASSNLYELTLEGTPLTREFEIPSDATFEDLSEVIQNMMAWSDVRVHRFIVGDTILGGMELLLKDDDADAEYDYLLSDFDGEDFGYEYGDVWKIRVHFKERNENGDGKAHVRNIRYRSPGEISMEMEEYLEMLGKTEPEDRDALETMNSVVEGMEICTLRGGKYIEIPQKVSQDIWKALSSSDRYELVYDLEECTVCAVVESPKAKKVGWKKVMSKAVESDPERYILIRGPENHPLYELAESFRGQLPSNVMGPTTPVKDADTYETFQKNITRYGQKMSWISFLETNKGMIMDTWSDLNHIRFVDPRDTMTRLATKMGLDPDDDSNLLMNVLNGMQSLRIKMEPIECQFCGKRIEPSIRADLPPSTVGGIPYQQCSAVCKCGKENILSYLNDGYHSGYHYRGTSAPWYEYRYYAALYRKLPSKIDSDATASLYADALEEAIRCEAWKEAESLDSKLNKYYRSAPSPDSESFDAYVRYLDLSARQRKDKKTDSRLKSLISSNVPLKGLVGAEAYANANCWYEECSKKALDILSGIECDPYERGRIAALTAPESIDGSEPEGYGDNIIQALEGITEDIGSGGFKRRWMLTVAAQMVELASEHAHRCGDWKRVLPILNRLETILQGLEPKEYADDPLDDEDIDDDNEDDEEIPIGEAIEKATDRVGSKWEPPSRCNGLPTILEYKLGCYYLTDGKNENKGYRYMKNMAENARKRCDIGPITASRLILSEALAYRSDRDESRLDNAVGLTGNLDRMGWSNISPYVEFVYCAVSKWTGDRILIKMLDAGLPVNRGIKDMKYHKEMVWELNTSWIV